MAHEKTSPSGILCTRSQQKKTPHTGKCLPYTLYRKLCELLPPPTQPIFYVLNGYIAYCTGVTLCHCHNRNKNHTITTVLPPLKVARCVVALLEPVHLRIATSKNENVRSYRPPISRKRVQQHESYIGMLRASRVALYAAIRKPSLPHKPGLIASRGRSCIVICFQHFVPLNLLSLKQIAPPPLAKHTYRISDRKGLPIESLTQPVYRTADPPDLSDFWSNGSDPTDQSLASARFLIATY